MSASAIRTVREIVPSELHQRLEQELQTNVELRGRCRSLARQLAAATAEIRRLETEFRRLKSG